MWQPFHMSNAPFEERLVADGAPPLLIRQFAYALRQYQSGSSPLIRDADISPVHNLPRQDALADYADAGRHAMQKAVVIKLNGGLGTSMGLEKAKSLIPVKPGLSFLDIIIEQVLAIRQQYATQTPLLFMNSFATRDDTLAALARKPELQRGQVDLPLDFLQHRVPKIVADSGQPAVHDTQPELAWCPPGHGDLYTCLQTTGILDRLLVQGYRYAFVSNADNLGASLDPLILGFVAANNYPFVMETTRRTPADRKGGHLAVSWDGRYVLRESAQCPENERSSFQDIQRYRYFNTNSLWIDLLQLHHYLQEVDGIMPLPVMVNRKTLDPRDPSSPAVVQLETAMGAALSILSGAVAIDVPRTRFAPVKTTDDLLALRSDCFSLDEWNRIRPNPARTLPAIDIQLDPAHYKMLPDFESRFANGAPSLIACRSLRIQGDVSFGKDIVCEGDVSIVSEKQTTIPDGSRLSGHVQL
jgi:UTP--glucose-1-phosphate uridylyltransferase